jgi:hypothetical protein
MFEVMGLHELAELRGVRGPWPSALLAMQDEDYGSFLLEPLLLLSKPLQANLCACFFHGRVS